MDWDFQTLRFRGAVMLALVSGLGAIGFKSHAESLETPHDSLAPTPFAFRGRAVDCVVNHAGTLAYVKSDSGIEIVHLQSGATSAQPFGGGTSQTGIALSPDGRVLACSDAASSIHLFHVDGDSLTPLRTIRLVAKNVKGASYPCGLAFSPDGKWLYACLSRDNSVAALNLISGAVSRIPTAPAPFAITLFDRGLRALVSCQSAAPHQGQSTETSSGTVVPVDARGIATHGAECLLDLKKHKVLRQIQIGLLPGRPLLENNRAYIPDANSDSVTVLALPSLKLLSSWPVSDPGQFGASPNDIARVKNGLLAVACGGANQVRFFTPSGTRVSSVKTDDYPIAVASTKGKLWVLCARGLGNTTQPPQHGTGYAVFDSRATIRPLPTPATQIAKPDQMIASSEKSLPRAITHVVYIIKENRTYDQVFGDLADGDPSLLDFGQPITPNEHALALRFGLLTRYFCDSVISTDGHAWATEANSTAYLERSFGGWTRSYPWGDDPLAISKSGAIWDDALDHGKSVRNYGEYVYANLPPGSSFTAIYNDWKQGKPIPWTPAIEERRLWSISDHQFPGWNLTIPDQVRADEYIADYNRRMKKGIAPPALTILYLEQDHTSGQATGAPTPKAMNADNDLAVGRVVEAISHSKYWSSTAIFVNEDDPQDGYDHIDGHRSPCLVISPYSSGLGVNRSKYDQSSVLHTIESLLHIPPMTRFDRAAPVMYNCFKSTPDLSPYTALAPQISLVELNGSGQQALKFDYPDENDDLALNLQIWHSDHPGKPYPRGSSHTKQTGVDKD